MSATDLPRLPASLDEVAVPRLPSKAYYISDFLSVEEEQSILDKIASAPKPRWKHLTHRRLQTWPSDLVKDTLLEAPLPPWLENPVIPRLTSIPVSGTTGAAGRTLFDDSPHQRPNHVLINEYPPGVGIMPHKDGAAYYPVVCTVSLGGSLCLDFYQSKPDGTVEAQPKWRVLQEPRSLLITSESLYTDYLHGIADIDTDTDLSRDTVTNWDVLRSKADFDSGRNERRVRTSLTYRDVVRVSKLGSKMGLLSRR